MSRTAVLADAGARVEGLVLDALAYADGELDVSETPAARCSDMARTRSGRGHTARERERACIRTSRTCPRIFFVFSLVHLPRALFLPTPSCRTACARL
jgi:hypothetical protein